MNHTLVESISLMLFDAKLPQRFWAEAVTTDVYFHNHSQSRSWTGNKPVVDHLQVFGCAVYDHIPKGDRQKLGSKS